MTVGQLTAQRRELERELALIDAELCELCAMSNRSVALQRRRAEVRAALQRVLGQLGALRGELPRPISAAWYRRR
jgi:hypothetical protein